MSISQWIILLKLKADGEFMMSELAKIAGFSTAACTVCIDRLDEMGLIQRKRDPLDRRKNIIVLSIVGANKVNSLIARQA